jgi:hemoglobin
MRHAPFAIDDDARDRWVTHMRSALDATMSEHGLDPAWEQQLWRYLVGAAISMVNTETPAPGLAPGTTSL